MFRIIRIVPLILAFIGFILVWYLNPSYPMLGLMTVGLLIAALWFIKKYKL